MSKADYKILVRKRKQAWKLARPAKYPGGIIPDLKTAKRITANLRLQGYETRLERLAQPLDIAGRGSWGALPPRDITRDNWLDGVTMIVHHTAGAVPRFNTRRLERRLMRTIAAQHRSQGWSDIGYNYCIMPSGRVYVARGFGVRGAHVLDHNTDTCGVSFVGNYTDRRPTAEAIAAYALLRNDLRRQGAKITRTLRHSDLNPTACPAKAGDAVGLP
jgi:N-acetylmuramoyl-L-alanine amidase